MRQQERQRSDTLLISGRVQCIGKNIPNIIGVNELHIPVRKNTLSNFLTCAEHHHGLMPGIRLNQIHQAKHLSPWSLNPLKEYPAADYQKPRNS